MPEGLPSKAAEYVIKVPPLEALCSYVLIAFFCTRLQQGDSRIYSIAAASIIAKITRDRIMQELHVQYPQYNLAKHKARLRLCIGAASRYMC